MADSVSTGLQVRNLRKSYKKRPVIRDGALWLLGWDAAVQAALGL